MVLGSRWHSIERIILKHLLAKACWCNFALAIEGCSDFPQHAVAWTTCTQRIVEFKKLKIVKTALPQVNLSASKRQTPTTSPLQTPDSTHPQTRFWSQAAATKTRTFVVVGPAPLKSTWRHTYGPRISNIQRLGGKDALATVISRTKNAKGVGCTASVSAFLQGTQRAKDPDKLP